MPWKGATNNQEQFVSMKDAVAEFLGFDKAKREQLSYEVTVQKKDKSNGEKVSGTTKIKRRRRPGYRQRSIIVIFQKGKAAAPGRKSTLVGKPVTIGKSTYKSIQFPITKSVLIDEVIAYFETGAGAKLKALRIIDANSGQGYPIIQK